MASERVKNTEALNKIFKEHSLQISDETVLECYEDYSFTMDQVEKHHTLYNEIIDFDPMNTMIEHDITTELVSNAAEDPYAADKYFEVEYQTLCKASEIMTQEKLMSRECLQTGSSRI